MPNPNLPFVANGDIAPCRFVVLDTTALKDQMVIQATGATVPPVGISMEASREAPIPSVATNLAAKAGEGLRVYGMGDVCLLELGTGGVTVGQFLNGDAAGMGVAVTTGSYGARALQTGVAGEKVLVQVDAGFFTA